MKTLIMVLAVFVINAAHAQESIPSFDDQKAAVCAVWTKNAMYGATQRLRGAQREVKFINQATLIEMIEHRMGAEALYFLEGDYTAADREWLITSAIVGYEWMDKWLAANKDKLIPDHEQVVTDFRNQCLNTPAFYIQFVEQKVAPTEK